MSKSRFTPRQSMNSLRSLCNQVILFTYSLNCFSFTQFPLIVSQTMIPSFRLLKKPHKQEILGLFTVNPNDQTNLQNLIFAILNTNNIIVTYTDDEDTANEILTASVLNSTYHIN